MTDRIIGNSIIGRSIIGGAPSTSAGSLNLFPVYGSARLGEDGVVDRFSGTSADDIGDHIGILNATYDSLAGFKLDNDPALGGAAKWNNAALTTLIPNRAVDGFTLQFEIEKGMFAIDAVSNVSPTTSLLMVDTAGSQARFDRDGGTDAWSLSYDGVFEASVQTNNRTSDTHDTILYTQFGSGHALEGVSRLYRNEFIIAETAVPTTVRVATDLFIGGQGGIFGVLQMNPEFFIRNVLLIDHALDLTEDKRVVFLCDSQGQRGQYPLRVNTHYPDSTPLLYGYEGAGADVQPLDEAVPGPAALNASFFDESWFASFHRVMAEKGVHTDEIETYSRGGSILWADPAWSPGYYAFWEGLQLEKRVDAMLNTAAGEFPTPQLADPDVDIIVISMGSNDRAAWVGQGGVNKTGLTSAIETEIDRLIVASTPSQILMTDMPPLVSNHPDHPQNPEKLQIDADLNEVIRGLDGYGGVVEVVNIGGMPNPAGFIADTNVHFNPTGYKYISERLRDKL